MTQVDIAQELGVTKAYVNALLAGRTRFGKKQAEIWSERFGLSKAWLLTGEGEMCVERTEPKIDATTMRPRIPITASAGFLSRMAQGVTYEDCEMLPIIPGVPDYRATITVRGDSMEPRYESGDELAITPVRDRASLQWGHVYVLDTVDGVLLKRIYDHHDTIRCVSYNSDYPDSFIDKSSINSIWRVVALLRRF